ncbi:MAG: DUF4399 domain-containing protein [Verrucomicrobiota bacterium]|nr:DUF4399 domain-containing protein [Verrucomicrobiota bacterium]
MKTLPKTLAMCLAGAVLATATLQANDKIKRTPSPKGARVYLIGVKDGKTVKAKKGKVVVRFGLKGMGVCPAGLLIDGKPLPNTGHHHLLVDVDKAPPLDMPLPSTPNVRHFGLGQTEVTLELKPGKHTLQLVFADHLHIPHDPPVISDKITITVE